MTAALALMAQAARRRRASCTSRCTTRSPTPRMDTGSYREFAEGYFLTAKAMAWFWDCYCPDLERRAEPSASPLRASDEQLAGLPPALADRRRGRRAARRGRGLRRALRAAGVAVTTVRYNGIMHDFMMLNPLRDTHATRGRDRPGHRHPAPGAPRRLTPDRRRAARHQARRGGLTTSKESRDASYRALLLRRSARAGPAESAALSRSSMVHPSSRRRSSRAPASWRPGRTARRRRCPELCENGSPESVAPARPLSDRYGTSTSRRRAMTVSSWPRG